VVRADNSYDGLAGMINKVRSGQNVRIAAGKDGSGGRVTLGYILRANPVWQRVVSVESYGEETALDRIKDGEIDGFFVMDAPNSDLINRIKTAVDAKGKRLYKFQDVRPGNELYQTKDWNGKYLFQEATISAGWFSDTRTVSVDAQMITANSYREDRAQHGPEVVSTIINAIDQAQAAIFADTNTPQNWIPASAKR
jgi:TRAP-type uncharacterized transport system substrate-binding protein